LCSFGRGHVRAESESTMIGQMAAQFDVIDHAGKRVRLADLVGKWVVVSFYPKDFTPLCTAQNCGLRDKYAELVDAGAVVIGVSGDSEESHRKFAEKNRLSYSLVSDGNGELAKGLGVKRPFFGLLPARATVVIDPSGKIREIYSASFAGAAHAKRALDAIRAGRA
jgi:thioredoxin-dependent peroxiredoxin